MKKVFNLINLALIFLVLLGDSFYIAVSVGALKLDGGSLWLKGLTSAMFVALGAVNLAYAILKRKGNLRFCIVMLLGLVFGMAGDIVLNVHFIGGAVLFAIAHVFYFASYCTLLKFRWQDLLYGAAIFVPSVLLITLAPFFDFGGVLMEIVCVIYAIIISCMVGKSISNLVKARTLLNVVLVVGSCLFFFSDLMLLLNVFASLPKVVDVLCLVTYYPAQCLLAYSIMIEACEVKND